MAIKIVNTIEEFNNEINNGRVVVDFYADWCGPCKMLAPIYEELSNEETEVKFIKVNTDNSQDIAQKYNIMSIPTLIYFKDGQLVQQAAGFMPKELLKQFINK